MERSQFLCLCLHILLFTWFSSGPASYPINYLDESRDWCKPAIQMPYHLQDPSDTVSSTFPLSTVCTAAVGLGMPRPVARPSGIAAVAASSLVSLVHCQQLQPRWACGAPAQAPACWSSPVCCHGAWCQVPSVGSRVMGPCMWGQPGGLYRSLFCCFPGQAI